MNNTVHVLYVDDETGLLEIGKLFLEQVGDFSVDTIDSASAALELIEKTPFDAIISDYQMPGLDGIQFLIEVRKKFGSVPFILFTGRGREEVVIQAINNGADFYLQKGGEPEAQFVELAHKIRSAVDHHRDELKISTLNRLYGVLSATNNAIVRIQTKKELMEEICRIAVDNGGFVMAWAGLADEENKTIRPTCAHGHLDGYLETIDISTKNIPRGLGPTGTAYREKIISYCNDIVTDPRMEPWREKALERGYRSNAAFPFAIGTRNAGVMTLYAAEPGFFTDQILKLLDELSENISFALVAMDSDEEKRVSEEALKISEEKYRRIVDTSHEGIWAMDNQFVTTYVNERLAEMLGYTVDEILGKTIQSFMFEEELADQQLKIDERMTGQSCSYERRFKAKDGTGRVIHVSASPLMGDDGSFMGSFAMLTDITDKKRAEDQLLRKNEELAASYEEIAATNEELNQLLDDLGKSERAVRESEELLGAIVMGSPIPQFVIDRNHRILHWNRALERYSGISAKDIVGTTRQWCAFYPEERPCLADLLVDGEIERIRQLYSGKCASSRLIDGAYEVIDFFPKIRDGTWLYFTAAPIRDLNGNVIGAVETLEDITERKEVERELLKTNEELNASYEQISATEEELRQNLDEILTSQRLLAESEEKYRRIVDTSHEGIWAMDPQFITTYVNERLAEMLGYTVDEILGKTIQSFMSEEELADQQLKIDERMAGQSGSYERRFKAKDGTILVIHVSASPILADDGSFMGSFAMLTDITDKKRAVAALTENEERLRTTLEILPVGVFIFSKNGQILTANAMVNRIWGVTRGVVPYSSDMAEFVEYKGWWPDTGVALRPEDWAASRVLMKGEAAPVDIVNIQRFDGSFGTIIVSAVPIHDGGGNINGAVAVIQDITERKQAEEELHRKNEELEASYEELAASEEELRHNVDELTRADLELRTSKRELTDIIEFLPDATLVIDREGVVIAWNRAMEEMTGICKAGMIGQGDHAYTVPFYGERRKQLLDLLDLEDEELQSKYEYVTRKGNTLYAEVFTPALYGGKGAYVWATGSPLFDDNGNRIGAIESIRDITDWKQNEKDLHKVQKDYHYLLDHLNDVYYRSDPEGRLILASNSWAKTLGYDDISECLGKNIADAFYADSEERKRFLAEVNKNGSVSDYEVTLKKKDGTLLPVSTSSYLCYDESGKVLGVEGTWRDITRRKQTDAALRESEDRFRGIFDTSTSGVAIYEVMNNGASGKDYIIKDFNKTALEIEGKKKDEVIGKSLLDLRPAIDEYGLIPVFQQVWKTGVPAYFPQKVYIDEKYSNWYENRVFRLQSGEIVAVYDDVTERKRAELELVSAQEQVKKAHHLAHIGTWDWVVETDTVTWSEELFNIAGRDPSQPAPTYAEHPGVYTPSSFQILSDAAGKALKTGEPYNLELELIRPDGSIRWTNAFGGVKRDSNGTVIGLHGTVQDITDRKTAEDALRKSEEKFRLLIDQTDEGVWIIDQDYRTTFVNNRLVSMFGYTPEEMRMRMVREFMPVEDMPIHNQRMRERLEGKRDRFEQRFIRKDGSVFWVIASVTPFVSENNVSGAFAMLSDITDRKRAEEELRHLMEFQNSVITNARVWLSVLDLSGNILIWNSGAEEVSGYSSDEVVGQKEIWKKIYPDPDYRKQVSEMISGIIEEKNYLENFETTILSKQGTRKIISWNTRGLPGETGDISDYIAIGVDVTDRRRAEEALRESEEKYRTLVEKANEAIIIAQDGVFAFANRSMSELLGVQVTDLEGRTFIDYIWPDDREWVVENYKKRISGETVPDAYDFRIIGSGGRLRWVSLSAAVIQWKGRPATINLITDITERKQAEGALREVNKKLNLLSSITRHDINNQLLVLNGFLKLLQKQAPDPKFEAFFARTMKASSRISSMIQFTKEYEEIGIDAPAWQDARNLVDTAAKGIQLGNVTVKNDLPVCSEVFADPLIVKVFYNLMDNAVRYGEKITKIRFSVEESGDEHLIVCEDDGVGIPSDEKEKIFDRGFGKNTGMGLFLSQEILSITGVTIRETGEPGKGARFELTVPNGMWRIVGSGE